MCPMFLSICLYLCTHLFLLEAFESLLVPTVEGLLTVCCPLYETTGQQHLGGEERKINSGGRDLFRVEGRSREEGGIGGGEMEEVEKTFAVIGE